MDCRTTDSLVQEVRTLPLRGFNTQELQWSKSMGIQGTISASKCPLKRWRKGKESEQVQNKGLDGVEPKHQDVCEGGSESKAQRWKINSLIFDLKDTFQTTILGGRF